MYGTNRLAIFPFQVYAGKGYLNAHFALVVFHNSKIVIYRKPLDFFWIIVEAAVRQPKGIGIAALPASLTFWL
jgi:hypothetical protein